MELRYQLLRHLWIVAPDWLKLDLAETVNAYGICGGIREIDDTVFWNGTAVIDADEDGLVVSEIGDPDPAAQGEAAVSAGEGEHVVRLAIGGGAALKMASVPGCRSNLKPMPGLCGLRILLYIWSRVACRSCDTQRKSQRYDGNSAFHHSDLTAAYFGRNHVHALAPVIIVPG